ncbi:MAG: Flp family type IVb pilin [Hyphomicrobiaceae bacterium]|nr:Flp family type IVb pilin [Hyphomicrobiaceae bacterium]
MSKIWKFADDESGATAIEYSMLSALIAIGIIAGLYDMRDAVDALYTSFATAMANATNP